MLGEWAFHHCRKVVLESRRGMGVTARFGETVVDRHGGGGVLRGEGSGGEDPGGGFWIWREWRI